MILAVAPWTEIWQTATILVVALVVWLVSRVLIHRWSDRTRRKLVESGDLQSRARAQRLETIARTFSTFVVLSIVVIAIVTGLAVWGVPIAPIVASLSVVGIGIGFGAQDFVKDVIAGLFVLIEDQYSVGDVVELAGVSGTVVEVRLRTTVLRGLDGSVHHIPNGAVRVATNLTHESSSIVVDLAVAYEESLDMAIDVITDETNILASDPEWGPRLVDQPVVLGVDELADSGVIVRVVMTTDPDQRWAVKREFLRRIKNRFDDEGIEIPYPHVTIDSRPEET
ncbi:MAG: mechanosensitive ion channel family protein [Actinomycetota bacterium]|nr:mechanosensitive ion channel family protein [Actinomycetota bacterium]